MAKSNFYTKLVLHQFAKKKLVQPLALIFFAFTISIQTLQAQPACCTDNAVINPGFETNIDMDFRFPDNSSAINSEYDTPTEWFYSDDTNLWQAYHIYDPAKASEGDKFAYIPFSTTVAPSANYCIGNGASENTGTTCIDDTYFNGVRYIVAYDFVPFNRNVPAGGTGSTGPRFEHNFPATTPLYNSAGTLISNLNNFTAVSWANVSTNWITASGVTPTLNVGATNNFFYSHDQFGTCGILIDNTKLELLSLSASSATNIGCGNAPNELSFELSPNSNVPTGVPNIQYNVSVPANYSISPTSGIYNQNTAFLITRNEGSFATGIPTSVAVTVADAVNNDCTILVNINNVCYSDIDQDGIADILDIDLDNDGIKNIDESSGCINPDSLIFADHWAANADPIAILASPATVFGDITISLERRDPQNILNFGADETGIYTHNGRLSYKVHQQAVVGGATDHIFKFSQPISGLDFSIFDVDNSTDFIDHVVINGYFNGIAYPLANSDIFSGTTNTFIEAANSFTGTSEATIYPQGLAQVDFPMPVDSVVVIYSNQDATPLNDQAIGFDISFQFCPTDDGDHDGIPDQIDLDADNDGIPDLIEAGGIDTNGDGFIDFTTDIDGDGLMDIYDDLISNNFNVKASDNCQNIEGADHSINFSTGTLDATENVTFTFDLTGDFGNEALEQFTLFGEGGTNLGTFSMSDANGSPDYTDCGTRESFTFSISMANYNSWNDDGQVDIIINTNLDVDPGVCAGLSSCIYDPNININITGTASINIPNPDSDGDGIKDFLDLDADNDGLPDITEAGGVDSNGDGRVDGIDANGELTADVDNDGFTDNFDPDIDGSLGIDAGADAKSLVSTFANSIIKNTESGTRLDKDNDGRPDHLDLDADNDGIPDLVESNGSDQDGDGQVDVFTDVDGDGYTDVYDTNDDTVPGSGDPNDALIRATGTDSDGDGKADEVGFTYVGGNNNSLDTDGDGHIDHLDLDADNDGVPDLIEAGGLDPEGDGFVSTAGGWDLDNDGYTDIYDAENNNTIAANDGGNPLIQTTADTDGNLKTYDVIAENMISGGGGSLPINSDNDSRANHLDIDADNDGILDVTEVGATDADNDGHIDGMSIVFNDFDKDGFLDSYDGDIGNNGSFSIFNPLLTNVADDGDANTRFEYAGNGVADSDQDDVPDFLDVDADNDGIYDNYEGQPTATYQAPGTTDTDGDGLLDAYDLSQAAPRNGIDPYNFDSMGNPDYLDLDSDDDNIPDRQEAWDFIQDGDSQNDDTATCTNEDTDGDGLIDCYDAAPANSNDITWIGEPADDLSGNNGTLAGTVFNDILDVLLPDNGGSDLAEPDYRDISAACGAAQVYYGITEAADTVTTNYEFSGTMHNNGEGSGIIRATAYCEPDNDGWYYFYNPLELDHYLFAIKNGTGSTNTTALWDLIDYVEIKVAADRTARHAVDPNGSFLALERDWHVVLKDTLVTGSNFDVKFYFDPAEMDSLALAADAAEAQTNNSPIRNFQWFTKDNGFQNSDVSTSGVSGSTDISTNDLATITDESADQLDGTDTDTGHEKNYVEFQGLTNLNGGTAVIQILSAPLPVVLSSFSAIVENCETKVFWSIESEENFSHFIIQSSSNGKDFETLKLVNYDPAIRATDYVADIATVATKNYFRLQLVDLDGSYEYSEIVALQGDCDVLTGVRVFPNPAEINSQVTLNYQTLEGTSKILVSDAMGRVIYTGYQETLKGWNTYPLDLKNLSAGNYNITVDAFGKLKTQTLVIIE